MAKNENNKGPIPDDLFAILACPLCRSGLEYSKDKKKLVCSGCGQKYNIEGNVPILLPGEGRK